MFARSPRRGQPFTDRRGRGQWARVALTVAAAALAFALLRLQVVSWEEYAQVAKENRLRPITVPAPRGTIYDRNGRVVAENVVGYQVLLMPAPEDSMIAVLERLRPILALTDRDTALALRRWRRARHLPMEVHRDVSPMLVPRFLERRFHFPGVLVHEYPRRHYPAGEAVGHVIGYVAEISREELALEEFQVYRQGRLIGKAGVERRYEHTLGGTPGVRYLEVDAVGRIKRWLPQEMGLPAIPGRDLQLHLDLDLQRYMTELFPRDMRGAMVAMDPRTGGILAMYSVPGFDPNRLVGGADPEEWQRLATDPGTPLLNRATSGVHPPGSTFKLATAVLGLRTGKLTPASVMPVSCTGGLRYQNRFARCWSAHGRLNLVGAIKNSCNVYFYQVGIRLGLEQFLEEGSRVGFGSPTGVDLPNEQSSIFPATTAFWQQRFGYLPYDNEVMGMTIGQNLVTLTPLKLAQIFAGLARDDGRAPVPRIAVSGTEPEFAMDYAIETEHIEAMRRGMRQAVGPGGTAYLSRLPIWDFMGKTGTATNPHGRDHGLFVGIGGAPGEEFEIVVAMVLEHGETGASASGYVANAINFYLSRVHGVPFERFPTPRERLPRGLSVDWSWFQSPAGDPPPPLEEVLENLD